MLWQQPQQWLVVAASLARSGGVSQSFALPCVAAQQPNLDPLTCADGGTGGNQCIMAARLGARTAMVTMLGADSFGHDRRRNFEHNGVRMGKDLRPVVLLCFPVKGTE